MNQLPLAYPPSKPEQGHDRLRVCNLPLEERPLYRLNQCGLSALATSELLALVLGTASAPGLAQELLRAFGSLHQLARARQGQLQAVMGIGQAQAGRLLALFELGRRLQAPPAEERPVISSPAMVASLFMPKIGHLTQEELWVALLDTRNHVLGLLAIYRGSLNTSVVRIGEIFRPAIEAPAAALILAHNHPSGDPSPSPQDVQVTREVVKAGKLLNINVLDHLVVTQTNYVSLKEYGAGFD